MTKNLTGEQRNGNSGERYGIAGKNGGIIQGMSGSPIIQNGKLIGAVTHVFVHGFDKRIRHFYGKMLKELKNGENGRKRCRNTTAKFS